MMEAVKAAVAQEQARFMAELTAFLAFPSVMGDAEGLAGARTWLEERLRRLSAQPRALDMEDGPPAVFAEIGAGPRTLLSYTHYDVQPPDPLAEWHSPPFKATVRDGKLYARGAADDKGDTLARIHAVEVYRRVYGSELPLRLKFFVEGEEEVGSPHLKPVAERCGDLLRADGALWEGGEFDANERYTVYCGVKGITYLELSVRGTSHDLHSSYAPMAPNAAWRLTHALATLKDVQDNITVDGLMAHVRPPTAADRAYIRRIPFDGVELKARWGVEQFVNGMDDEAALTRFLTAPTCTICGLRSGYGEDGQKTVLPATAKAKLDFRLVPDLTPELVYGLLRAHLDRRGFTDVEIRQQSQMVGARSDVTLPVVQCAVTAARTVYGQEPVVYPSHGGSGPLHALVQNVGTPGAVMVGVGYAGMRLHAPDENIRLDDYFRHVAFLVEFYRTFAAA
jgi:acetylornithine deacetylase/succinyl-diaminopimelate desuccinylase-like protein